MMLQVLFSLVTSSQTAAASGGARGRVDQGRVREPLPRHEGGRAAPGFQMCYGRVFLF